MQSPMKARLQSPPVNDGTVMPRAVNQFEVVSRYKPAGDQPEAIAKMIDGLESGLASQTLLGVTGSGKTFSIANVIESVNRPTLVLAPNKTLAAQLADGEFKDFFPHNSVEYFVSYYDYYQPEAYVPSSDTYIEARRSTRTSSRCGCRQRKRSSKGATRSSWPRFPPSTVSAIPVRI